MTEDKHDEKAVPGLVKISTHPQEATDPHISGFKFNVQAHLKNSCTPTRRDWETLPAHLRGGGGSAKINSQSNRKRNISPYNHYEN